MFRSQSFAGPSQKRDRQHSRWRFLAIGVGSRYTRLMRQPEIRLFLLLGMIQAVAAATPSLSTAQDRGTVEVSDTLSQIELLDGSTIFGRVTTATPERLTVTTTTGVTVDVERRLIRTISAPRGTVRDG